MSMWQTEHPGLNSGGPGVGRKWHLRWQSVTQEVAEETSLEIEEASESVKQQTSTSKIQQRGRREHLKVMTGRSATCRGAAEERNWIIYHCSFSRVECWLANGPWGRKKTTINAPEDQSQQERGASYQSFPVAPRVFSPLATIMKRDACEPEGGTKHWKKVLGARVSDLVACNGTKC